MHTFRDEASRRNMSGRSRSRQNRKKRDARVDRKKDATPLKSRGFTHAIESVTRVRPVSVDPLTSGAIFPSYKYLSISSNTLARSSHATHSTSVFAHARGRKKRKENSVSFGRQKSLPRRRLRAGAHGYPSPLVVCAGSASPRARARASATPRGEYPRRRFQSGNTEHSATSW